MNEILIANLQYLKQKKEEKLLQYKSVCHFIFNILNVKFLTQKIPV
jgi:hypothetical protein